MSSSTLKSILLIDDDEISNLFNKIFISKLDLDVKVEVALDGAKAMDFLKERGLNSEQPLLEPCLLLLDLRMPTMNGWEFLEAYDKVLNDEAKRCIVVVVLTTSEDEGDVVKAMNNPHIREIIKKPLSESKFNKLIKRFFVKEKAC